MSKQFKVGDVLRANDGWATRQVLREGGDPQAVVVKAVTENGRFITLVYDGGRDEWDPEHFELVTGAKSFKAGDVLRTTNSWLAEHAQANGANPERLVVRSVDDRGYPVLTFEGEGGTFGFDPDLLEFVVPAQPATVYKVISTDYPECLAWATEYASVEEAEEGIRESAEPGRTFEIFSVVRTVHKTVKLTERTETIRELNEVK